MVQSIMLPYRVVICSSTVTDTNWLSEMFCSFNAYYQSLHVFGLIFLNPFALSILACRYEATSLIKLCKYAVKMHSSSLLYKLALSLIG